MVEQSEDGITLETILAAHRPTFVDDSYEASTRDPSVACRTGSAGRTAQR